MEPIETNFYYVTRAMYFALMIVFSVHTVQAQEVIDAAGGDATGPGSSSVSYSIGQIVYTYNTEGGGMENQGVQQPFEFAVLPVTLVYFEAKAENELVHVTWETATEENNDFFTVERSRNGVAFEEVARVNGPGDSQTSRKYSWTDTSPYAGVSYYRLKQTDFDNTFTYSKMKAVRINADAAGVEVYPNPVSDYLFVKDGNKVGSRFYKIFSRSGILLETKALADGEGKIDMTNFSSDIYLIHYFNNNKVQEIKIIKY